MASPIRTCVASGQPLPQAELMRFVVSPDGLLLADLAGKLPGRGAWVTPNPDAVLQGLRNGGFNRALKTRVQADGQALVEAIAQQLQKRTLHSLHFCKKAGELVSGYEKVLAQLRKQQAKVLIIASDASEDVKKPLVFAASEGVEIAEEFSREALAEIIGKDNAVYLLLSGGDATDNFMKEYARFTRFRASLAL